MGIDKIVSKKVLNRTGVMAILRGMWPIEMASCISEVGVNVYGISFKFESFLSRATEEGPWSVMRCCFIVKKWSMRGLVEEVDFSEVEFWVQIYNLPMDLMTQRNAEVIGRKLGRLVKVDDQKIVEGVGRSFLRIRLGIKVDEALMEGFWLPREVKERSWAQIKYEKLLEFYFACGKLGHLLKNCGEKTKMSVVDSSQMRYGPWLRAAPVRKNVGKEGGSGINGGDIGEKGYERNFWRERVELKEIRGEGYGGEDGGGGG